MRSERSTRATSHGREVARFVVLACGITWILVLPLVLQEVGLVEGVPTWWHGAGALGPAVAAWLSPRRRGVYGRLGPSKVAWGVIAGALAVPILFAAVGLAAASVVEVGRGPGLASILETPGLGVELLVGALLYGIGEEPGWRGWLQPQLERRHSVFGAALLLTPIWAFWHAPFFVYRYEFGGVGMVFVFLVGLLAGAFWLAFLLQLTGSVRVVAAWHVLWNASNLVLAEASPVAVGVLNGLMMALGLSVAIMLARHDPQRRGRAHPG